MSTFQAAVLLLFNSARDESMTAREILDASGVEDGECRRTLQSLACGKHRRVDQDAERQGRGGHGRVHGQRRVHRAFVPDKSQLHPAARDGNGRRETNEKVFQDRQYQIDACLVRVMKTRKSLTHQSPVGGARSRRSAVRGREEAHREPHRARVPRARQERPADVQLPRVRRRETRRSPRRNRESRRTTHLA